MVLRILRSLTVAAILLGSGLPASAATTTRAPEQLLIWHPGVTTSEIAQATVVRLPRGVHPSDLALLRDDQSIETPSGRRISVKLYRAIRNAFATAQAKESRPRPGGFAFLPSPPKGAVGRPRVVGESVALLLARPPSDIVRLDDGKTATVAQMRAEKPWVESHYRVSLSPARPIVSGPATLVRQMSDLHTIPKNAPDSYVLRSKTGVRITLGELRAYLKARNSGSVTSAVHGTNR